jgi:CheY-like chemotaxis protein
MRRAVLVVEDEPGVRRAIGRLLADRGFSTIEAGNGREAIQRLSEETPVAIVIDLFMPVMSGVELLKALRRNTYYRKIPTVVVTGSTTAEVHGVPTVIKPDIGGLPGLIESMIAHRAMAIESMAGERDASRAMVGDAIPEVQASRGSAPMAVVAESGS